MARRPNGTMDRHGALMPTLVPGDDDLLGDLTDSDLDIRVEDDGRVQIRAKCNADDDAAACAERMRFLVEALGADFVSPPDLPR